MLKNDRRSVEYKKVQTCTVDKSNEQRRGMESQGNLLDKLSGGVSVRLDYQTKKINNKKFEHN